MSLINEANEPSSYIFFNSLVTCSPNKVPNLSSNKSNLFSTLATRLYNSAKTSCHVVLSMLYTFWIALYILFIFNTSYILFDKVALLLLTSLIGVEHMLFDTITLLIELSTLIEFKFAKVFPSHTILSVVVPVLPPILIP